MNDNVLSVEGLVGERSLLYKTRAYAAVVIQDFVFEFKLPG